jgi:hypothetical protein
LSIYYKNDTFVRNDEGMPFLIEGDKRCPRIEADFSAGLIQISGISLPENPYNYYQPAIHEIEDYIKNPCEKTLLSFKLEYFNTGSALAIRNIIQLFNDKLPINSFSVKWYYEEDDADMLDSGEEFASIFSKTHFEMIEVPEF